jgi:hypothetical protein
MADDTSTIRTNIRIIAETDDIKAALDKIPLGVDQALNESIGVVRSVVSQQGTGLPYSSTGNNAGGGTIPGYDSDGHPIDVPLAPPPTPAPTPSQVTTGGDSSGGGSTGGGGSSSGSGDKTGSGTVSDPNGGGGSRTDSKKQADSTSSDWTAIEAAMRANGIPEDVIAQARKDFFQALSEKGTHEVSDVYNGNSGYTPQYGGWTSITPNSGENVPSTGDVQKLNALVGQDAKNHITSVKVNLDGREAKPSDAEAAAAGQGTWIDSITPPLKPGWEYYEANFYWNCSVGPHTYTAAEPYGAGKQGADYFASQTGGSGAWRNWSFHLGGSGIPDSFQFEANYPGDVWLAQFVNLNKVSCVISPDIACSIDPGTNSREESFPIVGLYQKTLTADGKFTTSKYDSEAPIEQRDATSSVDIYSLITGDTYTIERGGQGGFLLSNKTNPDYFLFFGADRSLKTVASMSVYKFFKGLN